MEEYFNSKKYIILLVIICLLFTIMVAKIFDYMPKQINNQDYEGYTPVFNTGINGSQLRGQFSDEQIRESYENEDTDDDDEENEDEDNNSEEENTAENERTGHIQYLPKSYPDMNNFEEIPAPKGTVEEEIKIDNSVPVQE